MQQPLPRRNFCSFFFFFLLKAGTWYVLGRALIYIIFSHLQTVGDWLRGSVYTPRSLLGRLAGKTHFVFCLLWRYSWSHHPFCPMASNLADTKCRCCIWEALIWLEGGGWPLLAMFRVTVWGSTFVLHDYFVFTDFLYIFQRQITRITLTPRPLWTFSPLPFLQSFTKEKAPLCQAEKGKKLSFTSSKRNPPTSCNTFLLRASFLFLQLPPSLWYIRVH